VEKNKKEWEEKLDAATRTSLDEALERARKALKQDDVSEVRGAAEALQQAYSAAGAQIYAAQQQATPEGGDAGFSGGATAGAGFEGDATGSAGAKPEDVVEADYEIVDDTK
jgi:molecular chaperone DnaK